MTILQANSPAKINLFLHISDAMKTGYHTLNSLVAFTSDIYDIVSVALADQYTLEVKGPFSEQLIGYDNIITTATKILKKTYKINADAKIILTKNLPISSGIGGGSSNAATAISLLSKLWKLNITPAEIIFLTQSIGADIAMFYLGKACYINGIGEILTPLKKFPQIWAILINPNIAIPTPKIFKMGLEQYFKTEIHHQYSFNDINELIYYLKPAKNDLYFNSLQLAPILSHITQTLVNTEGCAINRMSGSGATCFGLFEDAMLARNALIYLKKLYPNYWIKLTTLE